MNSRTYVQTKKAPAFSVLPARKPAPRRRSLTPHVGDGHGGFDFGNIPLFSGNENPVQTKLTIGKPGDRYEQEADSMADRVMSMPDPNVQRKCAECKEEEKLQRQPEEEEDKDLLQSKELRRQPEEEEDEEISPMSNELRRETEEEETVKMKSLSGGTPQVTPEVQNSIDSMKGGGQPLPASIRAFFEPRFNRDFSSVRLHTDSRAAETAESINARAFTVGRNIAFGAGQYSPGTSSGKRLLAHELTHSVQQGKAAIRRQSNKSKKVYLSTLYKKYGKDHTLIPTSDIKTTKEYKDYVKGWKMDEKTALHACSLVFQKFKKGIFGREVNFIASGREAQQAIKKVIDKKEPIKKIIPLILDPVSLTKSVQPSLWKLENIKYEIRLIRAWLTNNPNHEKYDRMTENLKKFEAELKRKICGPNVTEWLKTQMSINGKSAIVKKIRDFNESAAGLFSSVPLIAAIQKGIAYSMWRDLVGYEAPWDFKTVLGKNLTNKFLLDCRSPACTGKNWSVTLSGRCMTFEAPANIHYGYVGQLAGFSKFEMEYGAAAAGWMKFRAEHPRDKQAIIRGYDLNNADSLSAAELNLNYYENLDSGEGSKCDPCDKVFDG